MNLPTGRRWPPKPSTAELVAVADAALSRTWTEGPWTGEVEQRMCELTGARFAVAFSSCTAAIHAALHAHGCLRDGRVVVPAFSFAGTVTGAAHIGARIEFADIDPAALTLTTDLDAATDHETIVLAVDLHGVPHGQDRAAPNVITDACQALGTTIGGRHIGASGTHAWSFSSAKLVAAPDGGAITTDDAQTAEALRELRDYGIHATHPDGRSNGPVLRAGGHNWRPSELSMALVAHRLEALDRWAARARDVTARLHATIDQLGWWRQHTPAGTQPAWHKVRIGPPSLDPAACDDLEARLVEAGIPCHRWGTVPLHRHPAFAPEGHRPLPVAERLAAATLCLGTEACPPLSWTDTETEQVCGVLERIAEG